MLMEDPVVYLISCSDGTKPFGRRAAGEENQFVMLSITCIIEKGCVVSFNFIICCQLWPSLC